MLGLRTYGDRDASLDKYSEQFLRDPAGNPMGCAIIVAAFLVFLAICAAKSSGENCPMQAARLTPFVE